MKPRNYYPLLSLSVLAISGTSLWWQHMESRKITQPMGLSRIGTITQVWDGDTLTIDSDGKQEKIRLCGVNVLENSQSLRKKAKQALEKMVQGKQVAVTPIDRDRDGRTVAEVFVLGRSEHFVNGDMVESGLVYHYPQYSSQCPNQDAIVLAETIAKLKRSGVWANFGRSFDVSFQPEHSSRREPSRGHLE